MGFHNMERLKRWSKRFAIITAIIVGLLSWKSGVSYFLLVIRIAIAYIVMYAFTVGSLTLFERSGLPYQNEDLRGALLDIAVGIENEGPAGSTMEDAANDPAFKSEGLSRSNNMPGQIDSSLADKISDEEHQAQIVRRMGWDNTMTGGGNN